MSDGSSLPVTCTEPAIVTKVGSEGAAGVDGLDGVDVDPFGAVEALQAAAATSKGTPASTRTHRLGCIVGFSDEGLVTPASTSMRLIENTGDAWTHCRPERSPTV